MIERGDGTIMRSSDHDSDHDGDHDGDHDENRVLRLVMAIGGDYKKREDIMSSMGITSRRYLRENYTNPAIAQGYVAMTLPDKLQSKKQRYYLTEKGLALLEELNKG